MVSFIKETKDLVVGFGIYPKRKLGQNFLVEPKIIQQSIEWAQIVPGEVIIEIGPGFGFLTASLMEAGAKVFSVEKDRALAEYISKHFLVNNLAGDALEFPVGRFDLSKPYKIVSNLPYAIASVWMDKVLELARLPDRMILLVQKEAADRWFSVAGEKQFCALGISLQAAYRLDDKCSVSKHSFYPQPKVESTLLLLNKKTDCFIFPKKFKQLMRKLFIHRRKQIGRVCKESGIMLAERFLNFLLENRIPMQVRAETIPLELWIKFARTFPEAII